MKFSAKSSGILGLLLVVSFHWKFFAISRIRSLGSSRRSS